MSFAPVRVDGGGLLQVFDIATAANPGATAGIIVAGSDTQGYYYSSDRADHWAVHNYGIGAQSNYRQSACLVWSLFESNTLYSCTGEAGHGGGLLASTDGGSTWQLRTSAVQFAGNHAASPLPSGQYPRSTGRLLTQNGGYMLAATYSQGIARSVYNPPTNLAGADGFPVTCKMNNVASGSWPGKYYARCIYQDPNSNNTVYAGFYDYDGTGTFGGIWKSTNAVGSGTPNFTQMAAQPCATVEDILVLPNGNMYVLGGIFGLFRSTNGGSSWTSLNKPNVGPSVDLTASNWTSIDGYTDGSNNDVLLIACSQGVKPSGNTAYAQVMKFVITSGGSSTTSYLTASNSNIQVATIPPDNRPWWNAGSGEVLGKVNFSNPYIRFDPTDNTHQRIFIAGAEGMYRSTDGGAHWTIANNGMPQFLGHPIVCDPSNKNHILFGDSDFGSWDDTAPGNEDATTVTADSPLNSAQTYALAIDPVDGTCYASSTASHQKYTNVAGDVFQRPGNQPNSWTPMNLATATDPTTGTKEGGRTAVGLWALRDASNSKALLACVNGSGMWRYASSSSSSIVGSTTTTGLYPNDSNTRLGAATAYDNVIGRTSALVATKLYFGNVPPPTVVDGQGSSLQALANSGCFFWLCITPDIHGADTATMVSRLQTWIAALPNGANQMGVIFYQEVQDKLSAADYLTCCQNNSAAVHNLGLSIAYDIAGHTNTSTWTSFYPGDQYVDVVAVDMYAANWAQKYDPVTNPDPLFVAHNLATTHGKKFGVFEMGSAIQNAGGTGTVTNPNFILYIQSVQSVMLALPVANRAHCMWYSGDHNGPGSNVISGPRTTIAAASSGGSIKNIANSTWTSTTAGSLAPGVLAVASTSGAGFGTGISAGNLYLQCDDGTVARIYYTGISGNTFTGCTYIDTFPAGSSGNTTVSTGSFLAVYTFTNGVTSDFRIPYVQAFVDALTTSAGAPSWSLVDTGIGAAGVAAGTYVEFAQLNDGSGIIYCFDRVQGVYRSKDYGRSWSLIWATTASQSNTGHIALNPLASPPSSELWVSKDTGLYKLVGADTGTVAGGGITGSTTPLPGVPNPGPLVFDPSGIVYVATDPTTAVPQTKLLYSTPASGGQTWKDAVGDTSLAECNSLVERMAIAADGQLFLSGSNIVAHGYPVTTQTLAITTTTLTAAGVGQSYSQTLVATGGSGSGYVFSVAGGSSLPPGLSISGGGTISGTPTAIGRFSVAFQVTDSGNNTITKTLPIVVYSPALLVSAFAAPQTTTTFQIPVQAVTQKNDAIVVAVGNGITNITALSDTKGNVYQKVNEASLGAGNQDCTLWIAYGTTPLALTDFFNATVPGAAGNSVAVVARAPGLLPTSAALDQSPAGTNGTGTNASVATNNLAVAPEVAFAVFQNTNAAGIPTLPQDWIAIATQQSATAGVYLTLAYKEATATAPITATAAFATSGNWLALLATLVELAATGVPMHEVGAGADALGATGAIPLSDSGHSTVSFSHTSSLTPQLPESGVGTDSLAVSTSLADVRASAAFATNTATSFNVPAQQCAINDVILMWCVGLRTNGITWSCPGFTFVAGTTSNGACGLLFKAVDATDVALFNSGGSYVVTPSAAAAFCVGVVVVLGDNLATPYDPAVPSSGGLVSAAAVTVSAPGLSLGTNGDLLVWFGATKTTHVQAGQIVAPQAITPPAGYTAQGVQVNTSGASVANTGMLVATGRGLAGATGTVSGSVPANAINAGLLVAIEGAPAFLTVGMSESGSGSDQLSIAVAANIGFAEAGHGTETLGSVLQCVAGAPSQNGFTLVAKVPGLAATQLAVSTDPTVTQNMFLTSVQTPDALNYIRHVVTGLQPGTQYFYQLVVVGSGQRTGPIGQCKTLPPAGLNQAVSFRVAFGSCVASGAQSAKSQQDWTDWDPDIAIFLGDFDYSGTTSTDYPTQVGIYETQIRAANGLSRMVSNGWGFYCRSEHEAGPNSGDSNNAYTATNIAAAQEVFPFGQLGDTNNPPHGLYQSWVAGRVRFIMLDVRNIDRSPGTASDNNSKTMLGAAQLAWLESQLLQPEPLKVIVEDVAWLGDPTPFLIANKPDTWWSYNTERQAIANFIVTNAARVKNVLLLHANTHVLASAVGAINDFGGFPVYCAAPLAGVAGGVGTGAFSQVYNPGGNVHLYGRVTFTDNGTTIQTYFSGWDAANTVEQINQTDTFYAPLLLEQGTASDVLTVNPLPTYVETGVGVDTLQVVVKTNEVLTVAVALVDADGGTATDTLAISKTGVPLRDSGTGTERMVQGRNMSESGSATTTILVGITKHLTDQGTG